MSSLTAIFGSAAEKSQDSEKLLNLYWNRAELKKEFADMRNEQFRLRERIKQEEGATARSQQKLEHIETLLTDPEWVHNVVVYFQLKGFALRCERKLAKFAEELKQQREKKRQNKVLAYWNEERNAELSELKEQRLLALNSLQTLEDQLQSERHRLMNMSGLLKIFRRRAVTALLDRLADDIDATRQQDQQIAAQLDEIRNRKPPENSGLDIAAKRNINLMILAFTQQLVVSMGDDELAAMVKEAADKSVGAVNYGNRDECDQLLDRIISRSSRMERATEFADLLHKRATILAERAVYRTDGDAVPVAASVGALIVVDDGGGYIEREASVLADNYFGVARVLSR